jgi:ClpP class serine protease
MPTLLKAFKQAIRDDRVDMIVFRVDSPGGIQSWRKGDESF